MLLCQKEIYDVRKKQFGVENIKNMLGLLKDLQTSCGDIYKTNHDYKYVNDLS